ncbi:MAG: hypothetical protein SGI88_02545 [Candidatus Hydrogenedentes bacterium]|nr:hypothetical protein [Candidatus Hydrogenedentota bacterium]
MILPPYSDPFLELLALAPELFVQFSESDNLIKGVHGLGVDVDDAAQKVFVTFMLEPGYPLKSIPKSVSVTLLGEQYDIPTFTIQTPLFTFQQGNCFHQRPVRGGNCISPTGSGSLGTLGGVVISTTNERHLISSAHVLDEFGTHGIGDRISQPKSGPDFATIVKTAAPWTTPANSKCDAGIAEVYDPDIGDPENITDTIDGIGKQGNPASPVKDMKVKKSGATTLVKSSVIEKISQTINCEGHTFNDVFITKESISAKGDSGALVVGPNNVIVGIVIGGNGEKTVACSIMNVIDALQLQGWTWQLP